MKALLLLVVILTLTGCTVFKGVTDVKQTPNGLEVEKCNLNVYFAYFILVADRGECTREIVLTKEGNS